MDFHSASLVHANDPNAAEESGTSNREFSDIDRGLHRCLSLHGIAESLYTARDDDCEEAAQAENLRPFRKIGAGACGAVFAQEGKPLAMKLAKSTDSNLWNDYLMHTLIFEKINRHEIEVKVPECYFFVPKERTEYFQQHRTLSEAAQAVCHVPTDILTTEKIIPLPEVTRTLLIKKYCAGRIKQSALADPANKDCLVRVYLGSLQGKSGGMFFSLRNFKLHLNQMVELQLDVEEMASQMGKSLAVMHWDARTDARDVEFALGSSTKKVPLSKDYSELLGMEPRTFTGPESGRDEDFFHRKTELWVLDFNQVRTITLDEAGVAQVVEAMTINDPYFPKPLQDNPVARRVWNRCQGTQRLNNITSEGSLRGVTAIEVVAHSLFLGKEQVSD
ncbi:hypothetical protein DL764_009231 [Monosporascus ibericus]|uniref:DUF3669 domain-containing protein n=1 Tax=Monosporascus ibericus TaxID=155417 RepID=A0A4Q4SXN3_9PEZI|nr:hypothetical protein DL764_009231 [Monosporascus ibericus]